MFNKYTWKKMVSDAGGAGGSNVALAKAQEEDRRKKSLYDYYNKQMQPSPSSNLQGTQIKGMGDMNLPEYRSNNTPIAISGAGTIQNNQLYNQGGSGMGIVNYGGVVGSSEWLQKNTGADILTATDAKRTQEALSYAKQLSGGELPQLSGVKLSDTYEQRQAKRDINKLDTKELIALKGLAQPGETLADTFNRVGANTVTAEAAGGTVPVISADLGITPGSGESIDLAAVVGSGNDLLNGDFVSSIIGDSVLQGNLTATDQEITAAMGEFLKAAGLSDGLDLSGYDAQKQNLADYIAQMGTEYKQAYDRIVEQINKAKQDTERQFRAQSQSMAEESYMRGRQREAQLAERGLGGSGLAQAGAIQERMTVGQARNELYQEYTGVQKQLLDAGSQASEALSNQLAQLKIQQSSGEIQIDEAKRAEQKAWGQYLGDVYSSMKASIEDGKWKDYQVAQDEYQKAVAAEQMSWERNQELANNEINSLIDDYQFAMGNAASVDEQMNLRAQYEADKNTILNKYGMVG